MAKPWSHTYADVWNSDTPPEGVRAVNDSDQIDVFRVPANERNLLLEQLGASTSGTYTVPAFTDGDDLENCWASISGGAWAGAFQLKAYNDDMTPATYMSGTWMLSDPVTGTGDKDAGHVYYPQAQYQRLAFNLSQTATAGTYLLCVETGGSNTGKIVLASGTAGTLAYDVTRNQTKTDANYGLADVARLPDALDFAAGVPSPTDHDAPSFLPNDYWLNALRDRINASVMIELTISPPDTVSDATWAEMGFHINWGRCQGYVIGSDGTVTLDGDGNPIRCASLEEAKESALNDFNSGAHIDAFGGPGPIFGGNPTGDTFTFLIATSDFLGPLFGAAVQSTSWKIIIHNPPTAFSGDVYISWFGFGTDSANPTAIPYGMTTFGLDVYDGFAASVLALDDPPLWDGKVKNVIGGSAGGPGDWTSASVGNHLSAPGTWPSPDDPGDANLGFIWGLPVTIDGPYHVRGVPTILIRYDGAGGFTYKA